MASFKLGDRVAQSDRPTDCGTIVAVFDHGPGDVRYSIHWDSESKALLAASALVRCSGPVLPPVA